ncbi:MAG TPA: Hsp20/alpha crystallin family protein [Bryobacteraceae bacterium]|nr:Hsp20/alpha crystallin family protein [Bryobacteraceae bacterium]
MPMVKYNPFEVDDLPTGLRLFSDTVNRLLSDAQVRPWTPAVDIYETENELVLKADLPEVKMEDIDIRMENGTLALKGERKFENEQQRKGFHRVERSYGTFARYFTLPDTVEADKVRADYHNGVLTITLPKKEVAKPRQVKVQVNSN